MAIDEPGRALPVAASRPYFLVVFGGLGASTAVVAVDADHGEPLGSARLPGTSGHLDVDESRARELAGGGEHARLVWRPSRQTLSPLYPVWEVGDVYVDLQGGRWERLDPPGRG